MSHLEDFKVLIAGFLGVIMSYVNTPLEGFRYLVLIATLLYTVRKWYIMEKKSKSNK